MSDTADDKPRRPQNRLLFWFAAALIPEAAAFQVESPRAAAQRAEILRHLEAQANDDRPGDASADRHAA
jgi:hypothetical protein